MTTTTVQVNNVTCGHCTGTIERELGELEGVDRVEAEAGGRVTVAYDPERVQWSEVEALLREINYPPA